MNEREQIEMLKNAVRTPVSGLSAVEVDTLFRARKLIDILKPEIGERPFHTLEITEPKIAAILLDEAFAAIKQWEPGWKPNQGLLFIIDSEGIDEEIKREFWKQMNLLRESWGYLDCHVIFFLLPGTYLVMLRAADHLADWISLKLHIMGFSERSDTEQSLASQTSLLSETQMSPKTAQQVLAVLEPQLEKAINKGMKHAALIRRYYLPMFEAAIAITDLNRAQSLRNKINETDIPETDLPAWWLMNYELDAKLRNLDQARTWAEKLLGWAKNNENDQWKIQSFHALGVIAEKKRDFDTAEQWYRNALQINKKQNDTHNEASIYHQLGRIAQEKLNFEAAEQWYQKALEIKERYGYEHSAALTYHHLGMIAEKRRNFAIAEQWYRKALRIFEKHDYKYNTASIYHQLGIIDQKRTKLEAAETWYRKALGIFEKHGYEYGAAKTYHNLGGISEERGNFVAAEQWYRNSLAINEKQENDYGAAITYGQLGILAGLQGHYEESGKLLIEAMFLFSKCNVQSEVKRNENNFKILYNQVDPATQAKLKTMWEESITDYELTIDN
jgi:tetratricopeptide (TPR) repeat protein